MAIGLSDSQPICRICCDMPVSAVELQKPLMAARDINRAPNEACTFLFMEDTNPKEKSLSSEVRGSRSFINKRHRRRRVKLPLSRNCRQIMEDSQDNLCQAVQEMQLNSESSVRKSECMQSGDKFLAKVDNPSEIAEDLSKLCMKD
ncbi:hypothetical protein FCM35_KLT20690 [Carex littledalei]|uniref:Uncharacterized protein n=1 Tax=Carex littledalei TaxID=544730 RepID=A0A833RDI5_9POAL|nr:hypothetical protein FCM35_KLT20690 [Carex littledalei]